MSEWIKLRHTVERDNFNTMLSTKRKYRRDITLTGFCMTFGHSYLCCGVNFEGMCLKFFEGIA